MLRKVVNVIFRSQEPRRVRTWFFENL